MKRTEFKVSKMDCPSEENLIRMKLEEVSSVEQLEFDIPNRLLTVFHSSSSDRIEKSLSELQLGESLLSTIDVDLEDQPIRSDESEQRKLLWTVLFINFGFFVIEMSTGLISRSMGLVADSLDMLADSFVYGISLLAVGGTIVRKKRIARIAGYFQVTLAVIGFVEVLRRFFMSEAIPDFSTMIIVSFLALIANGICLYLLQRSRNVEEAHMKASMIFTSNDVIINLGVITAGILVHWLGTNKPDLVIGSIVFVLVIRGAIRIIKLGK